MNKETYKIFRMFYDDNAAGGSSRWKVTPDTVERFINGVIRAFGNCSICYGKGYSTQGIGGEMKIKPCECDRGAQFERVIRELNEQSRGSN